MPSNIIPKYPRYTPPKPIPTKIPKPPAKRQAVREIKKVRYITNSPGLGWLLGTDLIAATYQLNGQK